MSSQGIFLLIIITLITVTCFYVKIACSGPISIYTISPNFTASFLEYIDHSGTFLISPNGTFKASITNTKPPQLSSSYYFSILHVHSNTVIWTANPNNSISNSATLLLTPLGLSVSNDSHHIIWSTPELNTSVSAMQLGENGNLVLVDAHNQSLWESFEQPSDTIITGQHLGIGRSLVAAVSEEDLSAGSYRISITDNDALMQWHGMTYWKMSMHTKAFKVSNSPVSFMLVNGSGLYLLGGNIDGPAVVFQVVLGKSNFRIAKLGFDGRFSVSSYVDREWKQELTAPLDGCHIPNVCRKLGFCSSASGSCSCLPGFFSDPKMSYDCVPANSSYTLPSACNNTRTEYSKKVVSYLRLRNNIDYFANNFIGAEKHAVNLSSCQDLCSSKCSCLTVFHENATGSCYLIQNNLGSFFSTSVANNDNVGYIKVLVEGSLTSHAIEDDKRSFPVIGIVLLPLFALMLLVATFVVIWLRKRNSKLATIRLGRNNSSSSTELEIISIAGLPIRFSYEQLAEATDNFKTRIGAGGFGTVYKGTLPDGSIIAVKKITSLGVRGKKEFCTEIAIIGNIHHVNLVRLKGFCVQGRQRLLVYEYMNKGSLDHTLFGNGSVLEWQERYEIALGTARGLAYLHSGCAHKIIHCDIKPENILLHENLQVKISDFGLSKLLSAEQSTFFTTMRGTRGYLAPEWLTSSAISDKTDVYSYGMVLLEIVRGRKNCSLERHSNDSIGGGNVGPAYFPLIALKMHDERRYLELADPRLAGRMMREEVERLVLIALCCLHEDPTTRPSMSTVVSMLEGSVPLWEPRVELLNFLRFYGRRFTEPSYMESNIDQIDAVSNQQGNVTGNQPTSDSYNFMSYMSSQQLSGPR